METKTDDDDAWMRVPLKWGGIKDKYDGCSDYVIKQSGRFAKNIYCDDKYKMKRDGTMNGYYSNWYKNKPIERRDKINYQLGDVVWFLSLEGRGRRCEETVKCYLFTHKYVEEGFYNLPFDERPTVADVVLTEYNYIEVESLNGKYYKWSGDLKPNGNDIVLGCYDGKCIRGDGRPIIYNMGNDYTKRFYHPYAVNTVKK